MKLRNKLILSCAALAAVATTAVSSTFAWYTSNTTVTASNITAASQNSGDDMLLIADGIQRSGAGTTQSPYSYTEITTIDDLKWGTSVSDVTETHYELKPLAYNSNAKNLTDYKGDPTAALPSGEGVTTPTEADWNSSTAAYVTFELYFKNAATSSTTLYVKDFTITNNSAAALPAKSIVDLANNYAKFGMTYSKENGYKTAAGAAASNSYTVNALRVLAVDIESQQITAAGGAGAVTETAYDLEGLSGTITDTLTSAASFNAHTYYNTIMETPIADGLTAADKTVKTNLVRTAVLDNTLTLGTVPAAGTATTINDVLKVRFKLFLNGWDLACFDACQGQNFTIGMTFTSDEPTAQTLSNYKVFTA